MKRRPSDRSEDRNHRTNIAQRNEYGNSNLHAPIPANRSATMSASFSHIALRATQPKPAYAKKMTERPGGC